MCKTCPYVFNVNQKIKKIETFDDKKEVDLVYGGKEAWANIATTTAICIKCENNKAYYKELKYVLPMNLLLFFINAQNVCLRC